MRNQYSWFGFFQGDEPEIIPNINYFNACRHVLQLISESELALLPGMFTHTRNLFFLTEASTVQQNDSDRTKRLRLRM